MGVKHALVCGASSGIGRAVAVALHEAGHRLTLLARRESELRALSEELGGAHVLVADMDDRSGLYASVEAHLAKHPVDILVHNSGGPPGGLIRDADDDDFLAAMARHLASAQGLAQRVMPHMEAAGWGRIVCITSLSVRQPIVGLGVSNTVRAAMAAWAKTWSKELPPGITVNTVLPGYTDTDRLDSLASAISDREGTTADAVRQAWAEGAPEQRLGRPEEVAAAVAWLCSDDASFVRGILLPVDGGRLDAL